MPNSTYHNFIERDEDTVDPGPALGHLVMSDDLARVVYFALANERDKVIADIASYHKMEDDLERKKCTAVDHDEFNPLCPECYTYQKARDEYKQKYRTREEDLMFLGEYLHQITTIMYHMQTDKEFETWLSV
jgi:hypothetical protein